MKLVLLTAFFAALSGLSVEAQETGPFGVNMGSDPLQYGCTVTEPGFYRCATLPKPHPDMEFYAIQAEPETGACWVKGIGKDVVTTNTGYEIRSKIDALSAQIAVNYSEAQAHTDWLSTASIWDEYGDWMMALAKGDRIYSYTWKDSATGFKADVTSVYLAAVSSNSSVAYPVIEFSFSNSAVCDAAVEARKANVF